VDGVSYVRSVERWMYQLGCTYNLVLVGCPVDHFGGVGRCSEIYKNGQLERDDMS
jgi:hypothetical protein